MKLSMNWEPPEEELGPLEWRLEPDVFHGVCHLIPWLLISWPNKGVMSEQHWNFGIGWIRWGATLSIGRWLRPTSTTTKEL